MTRGGSDNYKICEADFERSVSVRVWWEGEELKGISTTKRVQDMFPKFSDLKYDNDTYSPIRCVVGFPGYRHSVYRISYRGLVTVITLQQFGIRYVIVPVCFIPFGRRFIAKNPSSRDENQTRALAEHCSRTRNFCTGGVGSEEKVKE